MGLLLSAVTQAAMEPADNGIRLTISPRICSLTQADKQCVTPVHAEWHSTHDESLCLIITARPEIKQCWEHYSAGNYTIELTFAEDLVFQLRDVSLEHLLASETLRVIREAIHYRARRRQPWNIFN
jgi:hypothetical protein